MLVKSSVHASTSGSTGSGTQGGCAQPKRASASSRRARTIHSPAVAPTVVVGCTPRLMRVA